MQDMNISLDKRKIYFGKIFITENKSEFSIIACITKNQAMK